VQGNIWNNPSVAAPGLPQQQTHLFNTNDVWGSSGSNTSPIQGSVIVPGGGGLAASHKKDDVFGDLWGGFK
jgi:stromal membrane-associated protein